MSSKKKDDFEFTRENIDSLLNEIAKEYRKMGGKRMPAEITLIGGASVLLRYDFRHATTDIDGIIRAASMIRDAINRVRDRHDLPYKWLNEDFKRTDSYTANLFKFARYYRSFSNGALSVRVIDAEYLIAMKLRSGRQYKNDLSDIVGILSEHEKRGEPITIERIRKAASDLYGSWDSIPEASRNFLANVIEDGDLEAQYERVREGEKGTKAALDKFREDYPDAAREGDIGEIAESLQKTSDKASVLSELRAKRPAELHGSSDSTGVNSRGVTKGKGGSQSELRKKMRKSGSEQKKGSQAPTAKDTDAADPAESPLLSYGKSEPASVTELREARGETEAKKSASGDDKPPNKPGY